ncbi:uncharacterized protein A4U43_UnF4730 [Asparagus officinalis]|uniref:Uncharacterized protein n=1 Tax=Asparagus officinalis TaxID=4686 RepID=A0A1R3L6U2_ASPOF|nr:uncharacterized protein A4U43_UnF4730 [Asparagus officinalis]
MKDASGIDVSGDKAKEPASLVIKDDLAILFKTNLTRHDDEPSPGIVASPMLLNGTAANFEHRLAGAGFDELVSNLAYDVIDDLDVDSGDVARHSQRWRSPSIENHEQNLSQASEIGRRFEIKKPPSDLAYSSRHPDLLDLERSISSSISKARASSASLTPRDSTPPRPTLDSAKNQRKRKRKSRFNPSELPIVGWRHYLSKRDMRCPNDRSVGAP